MTAPGVPLATRHVQMLWGTAITLDARDPITPAAIDRVFAWFRRVDDLFSTWRPDSEIARLAAGTVSRCHVSREVDEVLRICDRLMLESHGAFDIRVGADPRVTPRDGLGLIDPSGMVKGWALERAAELLRGDAITNFTVNAGGDVITRGHPMPGRGWRIGIQHPWERDKVAAVVELTDVGIATSGRYERGDHIIDPVTAEPARHFMSISVIARDLATADGYATAALALGAAGLEWLSDQRDVSAMAITTDQTVIFVNDFDRYRVPEQ